MLKLNQILFNIFIKDLGTKRVRPPTLLGCVTDMEDTKKDLDTRRDWFILKSTF